MGDQHSAVTHSPSVRASWRLRLCDGRKGVTERDAVLGAGILLTGRLALTCAHVLPDRHARLVVEFPETEGIPSTSATVADGGWHPGTGGPGGRWPDGDVALLELDPPRPEAQAAQLSFAVPLLGRRVWMCGYPERQDAGSGITAQIQNAHGAAFLQLKPLDPSEAVRPGFSGAAVIDAAGLDGHRGSAPQSIVLGMVVGRYYDLARLPPEERQHHGYMIPTDRIVKLIPELRHYAAGAPPRDTSLAGPRHSAPDAGLSRELSAWLGGDGALPRPGVLLVATGSDPRRDVAVRESLDGADIAMDAAGRNTRDLIGALLKRLGLPDAYQDELRDWLTDGRGAPPGPPAADADGAADAGNGAEAGAGNGFSFTVAVHGVDDATEPHELVDLLVRLRELGCRVLAVCRHHSSNVWRKAARDLLSPTLSETASALTDVLHGLEHAARHHRPVAGDVRVGEVNPDRVLRLAQLGGEPDPDRRVRELRRLLDQLYADIARHGPGVAVPADAEPWGQM